MIWHVVNFHACFTHMWSEFGLWLLGTTLSASQLVVVVTKSCQDYCQPVDFQALLSMRFPSPGDLPNPRIMPVFCIAHGFLPPGHQETYTGQFSSVTQLCPTLCDAMDCSIPGFPVHHQLLELTQTHVIESVMPSNHLILCYPILLPSVFPSIRGFCSESVLCIR